MFVVQGYQAQEVTIGDLHMYNNHTYIYIYICNIQLYRCMYMHLSMYNISVSIYYIVVCNVMSCMSVKRNIYTLHTTYIQNSPCPAPRPGLKSFLPVSGFSLASSVLTSPVRSFNPGCLSGVVDSQSSSLCPTPKGYFSTFYEHVCRGSQNG